MAAALGLAALAAGPIFAACAEDDEDADNSTPTNGAQTPGDGPTTPAGEPTTPAGGATTPAGSTDLPTNAEDYAEAAFEAWSSGDMALLDELTTDEAMAALEGRTFSEADGWAAAGCDAGAGSVACRWESSTGETLELRIDNAAASAAGPEAVVEARFS